MTIPMWKWMRSKWLLLFVVSVLVLPELLRDTAGPANSENSNARKRRKMVAQCRRCDFRAETEVRTSYRHSFTRYYPFLEYLNTHSCVF